MITHTFIFKNNEILSIKFSLRQNKHFLIFRKKKYFINLIFIFMNPPIHNWFNKFVRYIELSKCHFKVCIIMIHFAVSIVLFLILWQLIFGGISKQILNFYFIVNGYFEITHDATHSSFAIPMHQIQWTVYLAFLKKFRRSYLYLLSC